MRNNNLDFDNILERKKKKKKKKISIGFGWGDSQNYGAIGSGTGFDGGGMEETLLRNYIREIIEQKMI